MNRTDIRAVIVQAHVQVEYLDRDSNQCASDKPSSSRGIMVGFSDALSMRELCLDYCKLWMNGSQNNDSNNTLSCQEYMAMFLMLQLMSETCP